MAVSRSGMFVRLEDFPEKFTPVQPLKGSGVPLQQEAAFQRCLKSMRNLLGQHRLPAPKVFISYSLEAEEDGLERSLLENFLKRLSQDLQTLGLSVFLGLEAATEPTEAQTREAMADSDCFLVIGTPFYKQSAMDPKERVSLEYRRLMEATSQSLDTPRAKRLLPLCYKGSWEDAFPEDLSQVSIYCDFREPPSYYQCVMGLTPPIGLIVHLYPALITKVALQSVACALVADFDRSLEAQVPRAHTQSLPERLRKVPSHWDEEDAREKSYSLIELVPRDSPFSEHQTDHHVPLLESATDPVAASLEKLGIEMDALEARGINRLFLNALLAKELSTFRYLRWAAIDHFPEKILQGLLLGREDLKPSSPLGSDHCLHSLTMSPRCMPQGRSLLLKTDFGLQKIHAARGLIYTTDLMVVQTINLFIGVALSYRLYEWMHTGHADFAEFRATFEGNNQRGVKSLVYLLSGIPEKGLWFLLFSPLMAGVVKGLWEMRRSKTLSDEALIQLQQRIDAHLHPLQGVNEKIFSYLWADTLRQKLSVPYWRSLSDEIQGAERALRWDGRLRADAEKCQRLFETIERVALQGRGLTQMTAMQSLAKIVHSLSIRDFARLQVAGYAAEIFVDILAMKAKSLEHLHTLAGKYATASDHQIVSSRPLPAHQRSWVTTLYAHYLLWWLGMHDSKLVAAFWVEKLLKLSLQGLFLKTMIESVLELIRCPDKKGFRMFYGEYEIWANELTTDCFKECVRRFRLIAKAEPLGPFLEQLQHFDLRGLETLDLSYKNLTETEIQSVLEVLDRKMVIKTLNLRFNFIERTEGLQLPASLQSLDLYHNQLGDAGAEGLRLPAGLEILYLGYNQIGDRGAQGLQLPARLKLLDLGANQIGDAGVLGLRLPASLQSLALDGNRIGDGGAVGLQLPARLESLGLPNNRIGDVGAQGLRLPASLQSLRLHNNRIGDGGAAGLQLPARLESLNLSLNQIGDGGAKGLHLPTSLRSLRLDFNQIGAVGAEELRLPPSLESLYLSYNQIGDRGATGLRLPASLKSLDLSLNQIGDAGVQGLRLPASLASLDLGANQIGEVGAQGLQLPANLESLGLSNNQIGDRGAQGLQLPVSLKSLGLSNNQIGDTGVRGLQLPARLESLILSSNQISAAGAEGLQLPVSLKLLNLYANQLGDAGARGLQLPASLESLDLSNNQIGDGGAEGLQLPARLAWLDLYANRIGDAGAQSLRLPAGLASLRLGSNQIGNAGAEGLQLPVRLESLDLSNNRIGDAGAEGLQLPARLAWLDLYANRIGDAGAQGLKLPAGLASLHLELNQIGTAGVRALVAKIGATNVTIFSLSRNPYNATLIDLEGAIQQRILLKLCQDQLCHANTPLQETENASIVPALKAPLTFSFLKKPFDRLKESVNGSLSMLTEKMDEHFTGALNHFSHYLRSTLSDCPSYFPNIHSPTIRDWGPQGSMMLWQFQDPNVLPLLSTPVPVIATPPATLAMFP